MNKTEIMLNVNLKNEMNLIEKKMVGDFHNKNPSPKGKMQIKLI